MSNQLRSGLERLKQYYVRKILHIGQNSSSEHELYSLTVSELEIIYRRIFPTVNNNSNNLFKSK